MYIPEEIKTSAVKDRVKQTLESKRLCIYDWMLDTGLHQCDLLVYAAIFDELRHEPKTPMKINLSDLARRLHYSVSSIHASLDVLAEHELIYRQGERNKTLFSLYPFNTLDLK